MAGAWVRRETSRRSAPRSVESSSFVVNPVYHTCFGLERSWGVRDVEVTQCHGLGGVEVFYVGGTPDPCLWRSGDVEVALGGWGVGVTR